MNQTKSTYDGIVAATKKINNDINILEEVHCNILPDHAHKLELEMWTFDDDDPKRKALEYEVDLCRELQKKIGPVREIIKRRITRLCNLCEAALKAEAI